MNDVILPDDCVECLQSNESTRRDAWVHAVWEHYGGKCANCGADHNVVVRMVVPEAAGGQLVLTNGTTLCRTCEVAQNAVWKAEQTGSTPKRPICVWISRKLYESLQATLSTKNGFNSMAGLIRYMMGLVVESPDRFSDLQNYQNRGSDLKVNLWVDAEAYDRFKGVLADRNLTVTDGIKGLMLLYTTEGAPSVRR